MDLTLAIRQDKAAATTVSRSLTLLLAAACGAIAANVYYAQPLAGVIAQSIGLPPEMVGFVVTLTQIGYAAGLLLIVPLGDLVENRALVLSLIAVACVALLSTAWSTSALAFLPSILAVGVGSVAVQVLVPYSSHMAPPEKRGALIANVSSGLMVGVMLSRPLASWIASILGWRMVFCLSAMLLFLLAISLLVLLPVRKPGGQQSYLDLLLSMGDLLRRSDILRKRAVYQCFLYGAFSLFWTATPLLLTGPKFHFSQSGVALFAILGGGGGVLGAAIGGRLADRGWARVATASSILAVAAGFLLALIPSESPAAAFCFLVAGAVVLDCGMTVNFTVGQRALFVLGAQHRSRLNGLYMALFFVAGALGSALGGWSYAVGDWVFASRFGLGLPALAFLYWLIDFQDPEENAAATCADDDRLVWEVSDAVFSGNPAGKRD